jgi:hypothetical protein
MTTQRYNFSFVNKCVLVALAVIYEVSFPICFVVLSPL